VAQVWIFQTLETTIRGSKNSTRERLHHRLRVTGNHGQIGARRGPDAAVPAPSPARRAGPAQTAAQTPSGYLHGITGLEELAPAFYQRLA
jgi:hypothetical protein